MEHPCYEDTPSRTYAIRERRTDGTRALPRLIDAESPWLALFMVTGHAGDWVEMKDPEPDEDVPEVSYEVSLVISESKRSANLRWVGSYALCEHLRDEA